MARCQRPALPLETSSVPLLLTLDEGHGEEGASQGKTGPFSTLRSRERDGAGPLCWAARGPQTARPRGPDREAPAAPGAGIWSHGSSWHPCPMEPSQERRGLGLVPRREPHRDEAQRPGNGTQVADCRQGQPSSPCQDAARPTQAGGLQAPCRPRADSAVNGTKKDSQSSAWAVPVAG